MAWLFPRLRGFRRRAIPLMVCLSVMLMVFVTCLIDREVSVLSFSLRTQSHNSRTNFRSPHWILMTPEAVTSSTLTVPKGWTLFIPRTTSQPHNCTACFQQNDVLDSYTRKWNAGFDLPTDSPLATMYTRMAKAIFVVQHGAVSVVLTSDATTVNSNLKRLILDNQPDGVKGIEYYGLNLTLDSFHFLHREKVATGNPCLYRIRKRMKALWTVGVRCRAHRQSHNNMTTPILTDSHAPPVLSPLPRFSVMDFSEAFFNYEGLWALFLTFVPTGESSSVWALWAQRLLQEIGAEMALTSLPCQETSASLTMPPKPSNTSEAVFRFVTEWSCQVKQTFYDCAINLGVALEKRGFVTDVELTTLKIWIAELQDGPYPEPKRVPLMPRIDDLLLGCVIHNPALVVPALTSSAAVTAPSKLFPAIEPKCKTLSKRLGVKDPFLEYTLGNKSRVKDIALVIIFYDGSIYNNIHFLEDLYRKHFSYLLYCGPDSNLFISFYKTFRKPVSYIEVPDTKGFVAYECVSRAMMLNYDVSGYLEMADDVILNTWTLGSIPRDQFWFQKDLRIASRHQQMMNDFALNYPFPWWPWTVHGQMWGAKAMAKVWNTFESIKASSNTARKEIVNAFLNTLEHNSNKPEHFFYSSSDIFYVPARHRQAWTMLSSIFFSNNVFLDIAVPTLINGLDTTSNIVRMDGVYLWYNNRANYPAFYRDFHQFFHPWKMGWIQRSDHANFLCYFVLPHIVTDLAVGEGHSSSDLLT